jgi:ABC-type lipoprotein export system ATPase subunit
MAIIEIECLTKGFTNEKPLFENLSLDIEEGTFVALTGKTGCGKTTLLNIIGGLDHADKGEVRVCGTAVGGLTPSQRAHFLNENIGFIFQSHYLLPEQTALANVMLPLRIAGRDTRKAKARAAELLKKLDLDERLNAYPTTMSGGECQRVAIARALANWPKVLLADEPTASLNGELKQRVVDDLLRMSRDEGVTVVMVTHDIGLIEPEPGRLLVDRRIDVTQLTNHAQPAPLEEVVS